MVLHLFIQYKSEHLGCERYDEDFTTSPFIPVIAVSRPTIKLFTDISHQRPIKFGDLISCLCAKCLITSIQTLTVLF